MFIKKQKIFEDQVFLSTEHLEKRYVVALLIIAVVVITSSIVLHFAIEEQRFDTHIVNVAGRQRMLVLKITTLAHAFPHASSAIELSALKKELKMTLDLFETSHRGLFFGNVNLGLPGDYLPKITNLFHELQPYHDAIKFDVEKLLLENNNKKNFEKMDQIVKDIKLNEPLFSNIMNKIVDLYDQETMEDVKLNELMVLIVLSIVLVSLWLEAKFIFAPIVKRVHLDVLILSENEKKFKAMINSAIDGVIGLDADGNIIHLNPAAEILFKYQAEEIVGKSIQDFLVPKKFRNILLNEFQLFIKNQHSAILNRHLKSFALRKDGTLFPVELSITAILQEGQYFFLAFVRDITEFKIFKKSILEREHQLIILNKEMKIAKDRAEESDRLKTAFLSNMSHEIRTPMNSIMGFSKLLNDPNLSREHVVSFSEIINHSCSRLFNTINDVLDVSRLDIGLKNIKLKEFQLYKLMEELQANHLLSFKNKGIDLKIEIEPKDKSLFYFSDEQALFQVFNNLLNNALKFSKKGDVSYGFIVKDNNVEFFVKDQGVGIDKKNFELIFERFFQEDISHIRNHEGAGLGLTICKGLVILLEGKIWVESEKGVGSIFKFICHLKEQTDGRIGA